MLVPSGAVLYWGPKNLENYPYITVIIIYCPYRNPYRSGIPLRNPKRDPNIENYLSPFFWFFAGGEASRRWAPSSRRRATLLR